MTRQPRQRPTSAAQPVPPGTAITPNRYFNREVNWLEFNRRVLEEAMDASHPLLERVKFLAIFHTNLDEFFMIRVSGLQEQVESGLTAPSKDGLTARQQLAVIRERVTDLSKQAWAYFKNVLRPQLAEAGIRLLDYTHLDEDQRAALKKYFDTTVYPVLTPLAVDPAHPFPHISNLTLSLAVLLRHPSGDERFARVKIPAVLPRLVPVPTAGKAASGNGAKQELAFVWLEQLVAQHLDTLFTGMEVLGSYAFQVTRDADLAIREDEAGDLLQTIEQQLMRRRFGSVAKLTVAKAMPVHIRRLLAQNLEVDDADIYEAQGPLSLGDLMSVWALDRPDLKDTPFRPHVPAVFARHPDIFSAIRAGDILLHHPYDSFDPVIEFVRAAAVDPNVLAIKQTIYRVGSNSPIVKALADAALEDKQVSVMVELKARFDEENNIEWARALERVGAHVVYGDIQLKTHCKVLMVVRREQDCIRRYVHLGTGNYNAKTAQIYTDMGLFTCDPAIGEDVTALFNSLTGYSLEMPYRKLLVSPGGIRKGILDRIARETAHARAGKPARIIFKANALTDFEMTDALYDASRAGVQIDLVLRGSCVLVPGVPGMSENIRVISIVGRFLEHHRIYYFLNGGTEEVWMGSADLMNRNLDRRVETLFPIESPEIRRWVVESALPAFLKDTAKARELQPDGTYIRRTPAPGETPFSAQNWFLQEHEGAFGRPAEADAGAERWHLEHV